MAAITVAGRGVQFGLAKQTAVGTANPPSSTAGIWIPWQDGCTLDPDRAMTQLWVGDGSRGQAISIPTRQNGVGHYVLLPRVYEAANLLTAICGTGSDVVTGSSVPYTHTITMATTGANDFYTLAKNMGVGQSPYNLQVQDAILHKLVISGSYNNPIIKMEADWSGVASTGSTTLATTAFRTEGWMSYYSGATFWGLPTGISAATQAAIRSFQITLDLNHSVDNEMAATVVPLPPTPQNLTISGQLELLWQDGGLTAQTYFGSATGTTDSATAPTGGISMKFTCSTDATQQLFLSVPAASFTGSPVTVNLNGPITQTVSFNGLRYSSSGSAVSPFSAVAFLTSSTPF